MPVLGIGIQIVLHILNGALELGRAILPANRSVTFLQQLREQKFSGPTGRNMKAQGNALGNQSIARMSPERQRRELKISGPTGRNMKAQGNALGNVSIAKMSPERQRRELKISGPTGRNMKAQGNALGNVSIAKMSPERAIQSAQFTALPLWVTPDCSVGHKARR